MTVYIPPFTSEFPDHLVRDCVPASALMAANKATHGRFPAGTAERELLQNLMGTQDSGADNQQAAKALGAAPFNLTTQLVRGWETVYNRLVIPSYGLAIIGEYQKLPDAVRNHGLQPSYDGLHCVYAQGVGNGQAIVGDPLGSTMGPSIRVDELRAYATSSPYDALLMVEQRPQLVGYKLVASGGPMTLWHVARFTHTLYRPVTHSYTHGSPAPVRHGAKGFWRVTAGPNAGLYAVYGHTQAFTIRAVYSDGHTEAVPANT